MVQTRGQGDVKPNEEMIRHMVMNSLRGFNVKFKQKYGNMVLCSDAGNTWRRDIFPHYKYKRKKDRTESSFDWDNIFDILTNIKNELKENFPYIMMYEEKCEADDIIAILTKYYHQDEKIMIVSGDKDFIQLQKYSNVQQYSPILKKYVNGHDPVTYIKEHILKGDTSDGVPNVLSPDNTFVDGMRQRPLGKKKIENWLDINIDDLQDEVKRNYQRNDTLINLDKIPLELETQIMAEFDGAPCGDRSKLLNYFVQSRLKNLMNDIGEF